MEKAYKRRNIFIKKDFQGKLILGYFLFVMGGCLLFIILLGIISADTLTISYSNHDLQMGQTPIMLLKNVIAANWIFLIIGGSLLILAAMMITHRIAGPLFRFEKALDNMIAGNLNDIIHLREHDEGKDLAEKINIFNHGLSQALHTISTESGVVTDLLAQARFHKFHDEKEPGLAVIHDKIAESAEKIHRAATAFTRRDE
ncbi:MAG: methyl-accepting chemotaxis protein [Desulfobulbaceae bacterium]|nr:MAG: methyl-accepting chemotaxis protein [Desulfobulbaceae bacterium]